MKSKTNSLPRVIKVSKKKVMSVEKRKFKKMDNEILDEIMKSPQFSLPKPDITLFALKPLKNIPNKYKNKIKVKDFNISSYKGFFSRLTHKKDIESSKNFGFKLKNKIYYEGDLYKQNENKNNIQKINSGVSPFNRKLSGKELSKILVGQSNINFGKIFINSDAICQFPIQNNLSTPISVRLDLSKFNKILKKNLIRAI